jgi:hypothetical protein
MENMAGAPTSLKPRASVLRGPDTVRPSQVVGFGFTRPFAVNRTLISQAWLANRGLHGMRMYVAAGLSPMGPPVRTTETNGAPGSTTSVSAGDS